MQQHQQKISPSIHRPVGHHTDSHHGSHSTEAIRLQHEVGLTYLSLERSYFFCFCVCK